MNGEFGEALNEFGEALNVFDGLRGGLAK